MINLQTGDHVIFTALKQSETKNNCSYIACSVVRLDELREKTGKIAEKYDKSVSIQYE